MVVMEIYDINNIGSKLPVPVSAIACIKESICTVCFYAYLPWQMFVFGPKYNKHHTWGCSEPDSDKVINILLIHLSGQ